MLGTSHSKGLITDFGLSGRSARLAQFSEFTGLLFSATVFKIDRDDMTTDRVSPLSRDLDILTLQASLRREIIV